MRCNAGLVEVTTELTAHHVARGERRHGLEHFHLFVAIVLVVAATDRWLHRDIGQHLQQMVLHHIADCAGLLVETAAPFDAELLRHGHLHRLHVVPVPDRLEERIGKAEERQVLYGVLAQIVVNAKNVVLVERLQEHRVQPPRRLEIAAERFFHDDPGTGGAPRLLEQRHDVVEQVRRNRQIVRRMVREAEFVAQRHVRGGVAVVATHVAQQRRQFGKRLRVEPAVLDHAVTRARAKLLDVAAARHADHGHVEMPVLDHLLQRRKDLLVRQVARGAEKDEGVGWDRVHFFSR